MTLNTVQIGDFVFHLSTKEVTDCNGTPIALRNQSAEVLLYLATRAGKLVTKDELIQNVWPETHVTDDSLVQCIGDIRRALGDESRKFLQTIPKKGYRLIVAERTDKVRTTTPPARRRWAVALVTTSLLISGLIALWTMVLSPRQDTPLANKPRIAVLAFDDFSTGEDMGYLSDAIAEGIITELARNTLISVIARNSSFRYRDENRDVRQIGEELGVHYVLEGSQQKSGDALKVTVQLIDATKGEHLWAHTYDQEIGDLFTVQDAIIKTVADRIGFRIEGPVPGSDQNRVTALSLHLQGLSLVRDNFNEEVFRELLELNERAIDIDPDAAYGYIGLAHSYRAAGTFSWFEMSEEEALEKGLVYALQALEIAPNDPEVHYVLARLYANRGEQAEAMARFDKAIALNPSASNYLVASTSPMLYVGRNKEAIERIKQAMGIDPFHPEWYHWQMGWALWEIEDCSGALASMMRMNKIRRGAHRMLAGIYGCLGEAEKAQEAYGVFYADADEPTISEQREKWKDIWIAPGSLDRWLDHMRIAGMQE